MNLRDAILSIPLFLSLMTGVTHAETCPPASFTVYFESEESDVPETGKEVIKVLAENALNAACDIDWIEIIGHTDSFEAQIPETGVALALARVLAINEELAANEVPRRFYHYDVDVDRNPVMPTPPGTKSPLNRRAVITVYFLSQAE